MMNRRILISGVTGFIGANLAHRLLALGADLYAIKRRQSNLWRIENILQKLRLFDVDLNDENRARDVLEKISPEVVVHCAVLGGSPHQRDVNEIFGCNLFGTMNLLNAFLKTKGKLFINTGSSSEYGIKKSPMKESDLLEPVGDYGISKAAATLYCQKTSKMTDKSIVTLRLFSPYGYFEDAGRLFPSIIKAIIRGEAPSLAKPDSVRDFCFIEDVMDAYIRTINFPEPKKISGQIFNIAYGRQYSVREAFEIVCKITQKDLQARWGEAASRGMEPAIWQADIGKARKILGWKPKTTLAEGVKLYVEWFKDNVEKYQ